MIFAGGFFVGGTSKNSNVALASRLDLTSGIIKRWFGFGDVGLDEVLVLDLA